jgi:hypothetical protein
MRAIEDMFEQCQWQCTLGNRNFDHYSAANVLGLLAKVVLFVGRIIIVLSSFLLYL